MRNLKLKGYRCRDCDVLMYNEVKSCPKCEGEMYDVDLVEEIVELVKLSSGEVDFVDPIPELKELGGIAGTTRY